MKKLGIVFGALFFIFLVVVITVPLVVDVDKYRPEIEKIANEKINGELKLGKLSLSLYSGLKVAISSIDLKIKGESKSFLKASDARLEIPLMSILMFSPEVTALLKAPEVNLLKSKSGKFNFMSLMKEAKKTAHIRQVPAGTDPVRRPVKPPVKTTKASVAKKTKPQSKTVAEIKDSIAVKSAAAEEAAVGVPSYLLGASLGIEIQDGKIFYTDQMEKANYNLEGVELELKNLGFSKTIELDLELPLKGKSKLFELGGKIELAARVKPILSGQEVRSAQGQIEIDASDLFFKMKDGSVNKKSGQKLIVNADFDGTENDFQLKKLKMDAIGMKVAGSGVFTIKPKQQMRFEFRLNDYNLKNLEELVPMLSQYQLAGILTSTVKIQGSPDVPKIRGDLNLTKAKVHYPEMLKSALGLKLKMSFTTNSMILHNFLATAPETDIKISGDVKNFKRPKFAFKITSKSLNIDKLLKEAKQANRSSFQNELYALIALQSAYAAKSPAKKKKSPWNPMMSMAKDPLISGAKGEVNVSIAKLIAKSVPITDIMAKARLSNFELTVPSLSLKAFGGTMNTNAHASLGSKFLDFKSVGSVKGISAQNAFAHYFPKYKETLEGKLDANWNIKGKSFPEKLRQKSIQGSVKVLASNGKLRSINFKDSIAKVMSKVPFLKNKKPIKIDDGFKSMRVDLKLAQGNVDANPIDITGYPGKGVNIKGKSFIKENLDQDSYFDIYDPNRLLPKEISNGKGKALEFKFTGPISSPKTDWGYTVSRAAKKAAKGEVKKKLTKKLGSKLGKFLGGGKKSGGGGGKNPLDKLKKKFKLF